MEDTFKATTLWLASGTEAAAALIIGLASIEGTFRALLLLVPGTGWKGGPEDRRKEACAWNSGAGSRSRWSSN